jgi:hypothetical protein
MPAAPSLVTSHPVIDDVLLAWATALGRDGGAYRGHVYRVFNLARALAASGGLDDTLAVAAVFHDLGIWSDETFDYLEPSARRAAAFLAAEKSAVDGEEVGRMIALHHKLTRCPADAGVLAEAFRRADLVDVSLGLVSFGLPRAFVHEVRATFPNAGFHACLARVGARWLVRHPTRPLPMMRW